MENDNQLSSPVQQISTTRRSSILPFLFTGVIMFGIGLGGGYLLFANKSQPATTNQSSQTIPTITKEVTPSETANSTSSWQIYSDNKTFSIKYPSSWKLIKSNQAPNSADIVNPKSIYSYVGNGESQIIRYKEYVSIISVYPSNKTASQVAQMFKSSWSNDPSIVVNEASGQGMDIVFYPDMGEGSQGYNYTVSNGKYISQMNTSATGFSDNSTARDILETFKFLQ